MLRLKEVNQKLRARIAILAVPATAAQNVAELLVEAGVHAILNFAPVLLRVPSYVVVRNVSFLQELAVLSYHLSSDQNAEEMPREAAHEANHQNGNGAGDLHALENALHPNVTPVTSSSAAETSG